MYWMYILSYIVFFIAESEITYRQISNISHTKSQNLNVSRLVL